MEHSFLFKIFPPPPLIIYLVSFLPGENTLDDAPSKSLYTVVPPPTQFSPFLPPIILGRQRHKLAFGQEGVGGKELFPCFKESNPDNVHVYTKIAY